MKKLKILILSLILLLPISFIVGCKSTNKYALSTPNNLTVETGGVIVFERVKNDEYYTINIDGKNIINVFVAKENNYTELYNKDGVDYFSYDASRFFAVGQSYSIKVKASGEEKKESAFTEVYEYTHKVQISTTNAKVNGTILTWDPVENASSYIVKVLLPEQNILTDTSENVESLDGLVSEYTNNWFDFSSILNYAGRYKFYIKAVGADNVHLNSNFSERAIYDYYLNLAEPTETSLHFVENELHLNFVLDEKATRVELNLNDCQVVLNANDGRIVYDSVLKNYVDINLNSISQFEEKGLNFNDLILYRASVRALNKNSEDFYLNSGLSRTATCSKTEKVFRPVLTPTNEPLLSWINSSTVADGYIVYVVVPKSDESEKLEVKSYLLENSESNIQLDENYVIAFVQGLGVGNKTNSKISDFKVNYSEQISETLSFVNNVSTLTWSLNSANILYMLQFDDKFLFTTQNSFDLSTLDYNVKEFKITALMKDKAPLTNTYTINYVRKLKTPTDVNFSDTNKYALRFKNVEGAIGYKVYIKESSDSGEPVCVQKLFDATSHINSSNYITIDLSSFFTTNGTYSVQVQAIAEKYENIEESELSTSVELTYTHVLPAPEFMTPAISKVATENGFDYYLNFYKVDGAKSYEIRINYGSAIKVDAVAGVISYQIKITDYLLIPDNYNFLLRAIPIDENTLPSEYVASSYEVKAQLQNVTNIYVNVEEEIYTLHFDLQSTAEAYRVRIVRVNDNLYSNYLSNLSLENPFIVNGVCDITEYVKQSGKYLIYLTALAKKGGNFSDSNEVKYELSDKLETVNTPSGIHYTNISKDNFAIDWMGDTRCDYYNIIVTDPKGHNFYFNKVLNTQLNINESLSVEGDYQISVKAVVAPNGEKSISYVSSPFSNILTMKYKYKETYDFERYSVFMMGEDVNFYIETAEQLMFNLWHHYLFGVDEYNYLNLSIKLDNNEKSFIQNDGNTVDSNKRAVRHAILRLSLQASNNGLYNFTTDEDWATYIGLDLTDSNVDLWASSSTYSNEVLFGYMAEKLIEQYPEIHKFESLNIGSDSLCTSKVESVSNNNYNVIFSLNFKNEFNTIKTSIDSSTDVAMYDDYGNDFKYLSSSERRIENTKFVIDSLETMEVSTTEQLLMAVSYGKKPVFVERMDNDIECKQTELLYEKAKQVLIAINTSGLSNYEKATRIFDWLEANFNVNTKLILEDNTTKGDLEEFYLEGVFNKVSIQNGNVVVNSKYATSSSLSKAFTLLCGIEGIEARTINGTITYNSSVFEHTYNKVKVNVEENEKVVSKWFNVDLMYSDMLYDPFTLTKNKNFSSHLYYMVSDNNVSSVPFNSISGIEYANVKAKSIYDKIPEIRSIGTIAENYSYYENSTFEFSYQNIETAIPKKYLITVNNKEMEVSAIVVDFYELEQNDNFRIWFNLYENYSKNIILNDKLTTLYGYRGYYGTNNENELFYVTHGIDSDNKWIEEHCFETVEGYEYASKIIKNNDDILKYIHSKEYSFSKKYESSTHYRNFVVTATGGSQLGNEQSYILNALVYAKYRMKTNEFNSNKGSIEIEINYNGDLNPIINYIENTLKSGTESEIVVNYYTYTSDGLTRIVFTIKQ